MNSKRMKTTCKCAASMQTLSIDWTGCLSQLGHLTQKGQLLRMAMTELVHLAIDTGVLRVQSA